VEIANAFPHLSWYRDDIADMCPVPDFCPPGDYSLIFFGSVRISINTNRKNKKKKGKLHSSSLFFQGEISG
jgi:hypothetical protein